MQVGATLAMLLMFIADEHVHALSAATMLFGLCLSNVCPTTIALAEQYVEIGRT